MNKAELRKAINPYLLLPDDDSDIFSLLKKTPKKINQDTESIIEDNFNLIVNHRKDLLETLLLYDTSENIIKNILTCPPNLIKIYVYIMMHLSLPTQTIIKLLSNNGPINDNNGENEISFDQDVFKKLIKAFGKKHLKDYICHANTKFSETLRIVLVGEESATIEAKIIKSKFSNICKTCTINNLKEHERIFNFLEEKLQSTTILTEKISILEEYIQTLEDKITAAESLQIDILELLSLNIESRQAFKTISSVVEGTYMLDNIPLYQKNSKYLNTKGLVNGLYMACNNPGEWRFFHDFVVKYSTSNIVQGLIENINSYITLYQRASKEFDNLNEHALCEYILNLSIDIPTIESAITIDNIQRRSIQKTIDLTKDPNNSWKLTTIYTTLYENYKINIGNEKAVKDLRQHIILYKNIIQTNKSSEFIDYLYDIMCINSKQEIMSGFIQTDALLDNIPKKLAFYKIFQRFGIQEEDLIYIFNTCIEDKSITILENIDNQARHKDKNQIRLYLYNEYLSDPSNKNQLFFNYIKSFITDDLTHTENLYKALTIIKDFIVKNPESITNILKLRHQVSKRSIEEQNAFCHTLILLQKHDKDTLEAFLHMCESLGNHQKRKSIVGFYKIIDVYYKVGGAKDLNIKNEILRGIQENTFPIIDTKELFATIAEKIDVPINIFMEAIKDDIIIKFIGKVFSSDNILQNKILGILVSGYIQDGGTSVRSNFCNSELLPRLLQQYYEEDISNTFSIDQIGTNDRPHLQHETSYTKHVNGITHKEQRNNIRTAFDELFDPDIYQDDYKPFMEKLYHQDKKTPIVNILKQYYPNDIHLQNLEFLLSHIQEIDTCLSSVKDNENDGQVYDNAINKAQALYQKIYKDILQTGNEQRAIRCEEYSGNLGLILHDGDITKEDSLRESMNLETTMTYDIVKTLSHMRGCIGLHGWKTETNLNYLLPNRFFLYSQNQESKKGVSDQIIIVISSPTVGPMYVMDTLYGTRNLNIIMNHIHTLYNHITSHKQYVNTPIFIPPNVISSAGINTNTLLSELHKYFPEESIKTVTDLEIDTTRGGYKEFTTSGEGILIYIS